MSSAGALIDYLVREQAMSDLDDEGIQGLEIRDIEILTLSVRFRPPFIGTDTKSSGMQKRGHAHKHGRPSVRRDSCRLYLNLIAQRSLQVFENESHASVHSEKFKEGLSLYGERRSSCLLSLLRPHSSGTLNYTKTALGRSLLYSWLLRPSLSLTVIKSRHEAVACFSTSENLIPANTMHNHLKGIKNVPRILTIMRAGKIKLSDWQALAKVGSLFSWGVETQL